MKLCDIFQVEFIFWSHCEFKNKKQKHWNHIMIKTWANLFCCCYVFGFILMLENYLSQKNRRMGENLFSSFVVQRKTERLNKIKFEAKKKSQIFKAEVYAWHRKCGIGEETLAFNRMFFSVASFAFFVPSALLLSICFYLIHSHPY